ncbi:beta-lactamase family protein [Paucibacter sp. B2R-40]|uniref:serine hydrolase domain-containing protein n=1 Tax=Paucibacter sp. B2R-40 TaxID=2893554 RepID=UPI0021E4940D|nr:serine hydrolase domain-containing protein [Paucibacter sp. B2R-40]MCV2353334.1 beta-lactamase family protein [Paucibacter sp. B2R-40]
MFLSRPLAALAATVLLNLATAPLAQAQSQADIGLNLSLSKALAGSQTPAIAAMALRDGKITQQAVAGLRRNDGKELAQLDDAWLIGSNGKPITAALLARLVDRGVLSWNAPLDSLLPELTERMNEQYRKVTLIELLSHRSGLPENFSDESYFETFHSDSRPLTEQRLAYISRALSEAPVAPPGSKVSYSNTGFIIAAVIAERATHSSYEALMQREVFEPLGMTQVAFGTTKAGQNWGHTQGKPISKASDSNPLMFAPAGNMNMRMRDWASFCLDQLAASQGGGKLLSAASYRLMQTVLPSGAGTVGWGVQDSLAGRKGPVLMHGGSDGNWFALVVLFPESGRGVLVAANAGPDMGADKAVQEVVMSLLPE